MRKSSSTFSRVLFSSKACTVGGVFDVLVLFPAMASKKVRNGSMLPKIFHFCLTTRNFAFRCQCTRCFPTLTSALVGQRQSFRHVCSKVQWSQASVDLMGCCGWHIFANQGLKRPLYPKFIYSATKMAPNAVDAFARMKADLAASLSR